MDMKSLVIPNKLGEIVGLSSPWSLSIFFLNDEDRHKLYFFFLKDFDGIRISINFTKSDRGPPIVQPSTHVKNLSLNSKIHSVLSFTNNLLKNKFASTFFERRFVQLYSWLFLPSEYLLPMTRQHMIYLLRHFAKKELKITYLGNFTYNCQNIVFYTKGLKYYDITLTPLYADVLVW